MFGFFLSWASAEATARRTKAKEQIAVADRYNGKGVRITSFL
jgi:hypothetical protein